MFKQGIISLFGWHLVFGTKIFSFYLFLKGWHFPLTRFGQNSDVVLIYLLNVFINFYHK